MVHSTSFALARLAKLTPEQSHLTSPGGNPAADAAIRDVLERDGSFEDAVKDLGARNVLELDLPHSCSKLIDRLFALQSPAGFILTHVRQKLSEDGLSDSRRDGVLKGVEAALLRRFSSYFFQGLTSVESHRAVISQVSQHALEEFGVDVGTSVSPSAPTRQFSGDHSTLEHLHDGKARQELTRERSTSSSETSTRQPEQTRKEGARMGRKNYAPASEGDLIDLETIASSSNLTNHSFAQDSKTVVRLGPPAMTETQANNRDSHGDGENEETWNTDDSWAKADDEWASSTQQSLSAKGGWEPFDDNLMSESQWPTPRTSSRRANPKGRRPPARRRPSHPVVSTPPHPLEATLRVSATPIFSVMCGMTRRYELGDRREILNMIYGSLFQHFGVGRVGSTCCN